MFFMLKIIYQIMFFFLLYDSYSICFNSSAGYRYLNSDDDREVCNYNWIDISSYGINININSTQDHKELTLPFQFNFNGNLYNSLWVRTDAKICFGEENGTSNIFWNSPIPDINYSNNYIGILNANQGVYYIKYFIFGNYPNRSIIIQYNTHEYPIPLEYEIILYETTNVIKFQYKNLEENGEPSFDLKYNSTVGIENEWGDGGIEYLYNGTPSDRLIHNEMAIEFIPIQGVFLSPAEIQQKTQHGATESFTVHLKNLTGHDTQFKLETIGNKFPSRILDYPSTGTQILSTPLIPSNGSFTLYPEVFIPQNVPFFYTDTIEIKATDINDSETSQSMFIRITPEQQNWEVMKDMPVYSDSGSCCRIGNNIYLIGGYDTNSYCNTNLIYDPFKQSFSFGSQSPKQFAFAGSASIGEKIYILGGYDGSQNLFEFYQYNTLSDNWTKNADYPSIYSSGISSCSYSENIYSSGGLAKGFELATNENYMYNDKTGWTKMSNLIKARVYHEMESAGDKIYVIGGGKGRRFDDGTLNSCEVFDATINKWIEIDSMNDKRDWGGATGFGRYIYYYGGGEYDYNITYKQHTTGERFGDIYNSLEPNWQYIPEFQTYPRSGFGSALMEIMGKYYIYILGGGGGGIYQKRIERLMIWDGNMADRDFENDKQDFLFSGEITGLSAPIDSVDTEGLTLISTSNTDCFGFWAGPFINPNKESVKSAESVDNVLNKSMSPKPFFDVSTEYIYRMRAKVSTDEPDRSKVPELRLRVGSMDYQWWHILGVNSFAESSASPTTDGIVYQQYFIAPERIASAPMTAAFDLLNIDPDNSANASLSLKSFDIDYIPIEQSYDKCVRAKWSFDNDAEGFIFSGATGLVPALGEWKPGELLITSVNNINCFGSYVRSLPEIPILPYRLYGVKVELYADSLPGGNFPEVRIRLAESRFAQYSMFDLPSLPDSIGPGARGTNGSFTATHFFLPLESVYPDKYKELFAGETGTNDSPLYLAIDLLSVNPASPETVTLHIKSVEIYTVNLHRL